MFWILFSIVMLAIYWYALPFILFVVVLTTVILLVIRKAKLKEYKNNILKADLISQTPIIKQQAENTGYTVSYGRGISSHNHYRYKNVLTGYRVTFKAYWKDGKEETITCKDSSAIYKILKEKVVDHETNANNYLSELDTMPFPDFEKSTGVLVTKAILNGYELEGYTIFTLVKHYQAVENIGIGIIRDDYNGSGAKDIMIITNRYLTPKAKEFCKNVGMIVVDRSVLFDMCMYLSQKGQGVFL